MNPLNGVLRWKPCFKLDEISKLNISTLRPLQAQRILSSSSSKTLATDLFFTKDQTRELITVKKQYWYKQNYSYCDHLCLTSHDSITHKQIMDEYNKEYKMELRQMQIRKKIFLVIKANLKLGSAPKHFEIPLSLLVCCDSNIEKIGHSRKNMDNMVYWISRKLLSGFLYLLPPRVFQRTIRQQRNTL